VRSARAGVESTVLFSGKNAQAGSFEQLVTAKFEELKGAAGVTEVQARARAIQFCVRTHTAAYGEYRARGGQIELGAK
jgi:ERCC4-type nuclease